jgi:SAM-dependent methyltransferase
MSKEQDKHLETLKARAIIEFFGQSFFESKSILDINCGLGSLIEPLLYLGASVTACSDDLYRLKQIANLSNKVIINNINANNIYMINNKFNIALCNDCINSNNYKTTISNLIRLSDNFIIDTTLYSSDFLNNILQYLQLHNIEAKRVCPNYLNINGLNYSNHYNGQINKALIFCKKQTNYIKMENTSNKKIAICLSGLMRTYDLCFPALNEKILSKYDCDVFIHCWDTSEWNCAAVSANKINELYKPKSLIIEAPIEFNVGLTQSLNHQKRNVNGLASMFYKIFKCNELVSDDYDFIMRLRGDMFFTSDLPDLNNLKENTLYLPSYGNFCGYNDQFAIGSKNIMNIYSDVFNNLESLAKQVNMINPEFMLKKHIDNYGISVERLDFEYYLWKFPNFKYDVKTYERDIGMV